MSLKKVEKLKRLIVELIRAAFGKTITQNSREQRGSLQHAAPRRRRLSCDESDDGLPELARNECRGFLFCRAADLADHDHRVGVGIGGEQLQRIDVAGADQRVATDPDAGGLAHSHLRQLMDRFVG